MLWVVMLNYFLHHFPLMCLGEVIIGDVLETLKMPFGRQMVHGNTRATYISRKMELCSMWNAGGWDPMFVHVPTVVTGAGATVPYVNTGPANSEANNVHHELQTPETSA